MCIGRSSFCFKKCVWACVQGVGDSNSALQSTWAWLFCRLQCGGKQRRGWYPLSVLTLPRMSGENLEKNNRLRAWLLAISEEKKCSLNQLALAWILHKGKDVVPIPGTSKKVNLESNIGAIGVTLSKEEIVEIEAAMPIAEISGDRNLDNQSICSTMQQSTTSFTGRLPAIST